MKLNKSTVYSWLFGTAVLLLLLFTVFPVMRQQLRRSRSTKALSNTKALYIGIVCHIQQQGSLSNSGEYSNDVFQQLYETGSSLDEKDFYVAGVRNVAGARKPDGLITEGRFLEAGENMYAFLYREGFKELKIDNQAPFHPILTIPLLQGTGDDFSSAVYKYDDLGGQAVIMESDGGGSVYPLNESGQIDRQQQMDWPLSSWKTIRIKYPAGCLPTSEVR